MNYIRIPIIEIKQNIGSFFIGKLTPKDLYKVANENLSRMKDLEEGIQRDLYRKKVKEIKEYLKSDDSTFPNTIILSVQRNTIEEDKPNYRFSENGNMLELKVQKNIVNILDGQHRLNGFDKDEDKFELPVSIFLNLSLGEQAKIFAKINSTQKQVNLDLVYDLFGITEGRSYEKSSFYIVKHLNEETNSPWNRKIKTLSDRSGDLAQGSMAKYIHKELLEKNDIFNKLYKEERDTDIKNIISNYFNAVKKYFEIEWKNIDNKYILTKTTGFNGFMSFLISLTRLASIKNDKLSIDYFENYIKSIQDKFDNLTSENYPSGIVGQNKIRDVLRESLSEEEKELLKIRHK